MKYELNAKEARVIGCMMEKQVTTPDQYPLSLNAITLACNQKTNREPVMDLSESEVQQQLDLLLRRHFLRTLSGFGNRVVKYEQRFCNSEFGQLKLSPAEVAVIATLLLRGAQLTTREDGPFVVRLPREPGKRESRLMHLFSGQIDAAPAEAEEANAGELTERVVRLEAEVAELKQQVQQLLARGSHE